MKSKVKHTPRGPAWRLKLSKPNVDIKVWYVAAADPDENAANRLATFEFISKLEKLI